MPQARRRKKDEEPEQLEPEEGPEELDDEELDDEPDPYQQSGDEQPTGGAESEQEEQLEDDQEGGESATESDDRVSPSLSRVVVGGTVTVTVGDEYIVVEVPRDKNAGHVLSRVAKMLDELIVSVSR